MFFTKKAPPAQDELKGLFDIPVCCFGFLILHGDTSFKGRVKYFFSHTLQSAITFIFQDNQYPDMIALGRSNLLFITEKIQEEGSISVSLTLINLATANLV